MFWGEGRWGHVGAVTPVRRKADCRAWKQESVLSPYSNLPIAMISNTSLVLEWTFVVCCVSRVTVYARYTTGQPSPCHSHLFWRTHAGQDTWSFLWSPWTCLEDDSESLKPWPKISLFLRRGLMDLYQLLHLQGLKLTVRNHLCVKLENKPKKFSTRNKMEVIWILLPKFL